MSLLGDDVVWEVEPAGPLHGDVRVAGSKNAVTKLMVAGLLGDSPSWILNAPLVTEVDITAGMLTSIGAGVGREGDMVIVDPSDI
ncbi:MAG TPA: hypothetical protein VNF50_09225, partial [Acidimicrobiales bacterium]|nr:hypothetical protein [Acidimicrobiales bacterium]